MLKSVELDTSGFLVVVTDNATERFPYVWLKDNCRCESCFHPVSKSRTIQFQDLDPDIQPKSAIIEDGAVKVTWPDDHESIYKEDWLMYRRFCSELSKSRKLFHKRECQLWGHEMEGNIPRVNYNDLMTSDKELHRWLVLLEEEGICIVHDAPCETGVINKIGDRVAYLRKNNYGETYQVLFKAVPVSIAYTTGHLGFHTDAAAYDFAPGMQMLHCISQVKTNGGANLLTDGFDVVRKLKESYPEYYKILTTLKVDVSDIGKEMYEFYQLSRSVPITLDSEGNIEFLHYSGVNRDSVFNVPLEMVQPFYKAYRKLEDLFNDSSNCISYKMKDGEISCFNNQRILHGRTAYTPTETGVRHLEGGYIEWDELRSMRRVLDLKLGIFKI